ncbi:MAG: carboxymuconolactone decarboxylase family protein [Pseudomonadota bacterium]
MSTRTLLDDVHLSPEAEAVFADIRAARGSGFVNNFWRALAHDPALLSETWERVKRVLGETRDGGLDPLTKELVYIAVSTANGCSYCVHSHTASARAKGMTRAMEADLLSVIATAASTNALATALQVPTDPDFDAEAK